MLITVMVEMLLNYLVIKDSLWKIKYCMIFVKDIR